MMTIKMYMTINANFFYLPSNETVMKCSSRTLPTAQPLAEFADVCGFEELSGAHLSVNGTLRDFSQRLS